MPVMLCLQAAHTEAAAVRAAQQLQANALTLHTSAQQVAVHTEQLECLVDQ